MPPLGAGWEPRGRFSRTTAKGQVADSAEYDKSILKMPCVKGKSPGTQVLGEPKQSGFVRRSKDKRRLFCQSLTSALIAHFATSPSASPCIETLDLHVGATA